MQQSIQNGSKTSTPISLRKESQHSSPHSDLQSQGARSRLANFSLPLNAGSIFGHLRRNPSAVSTDSDSLVHKSPSDEHEMESQLIAANATADRKPLSPTRVQSMLQSLTRKMDKKKFEQEHKKATEIPEDVIEDSLESSSSQRGDLVFSVKSSEESKNNAVNGDISMKHDVSQHYPRLRSTLSKAVDSVSNCTYLHQPIFSNSIPDLVLQCTCSHESMPFNSIPDAIKHPTNAIRHPHDAIKLPPIAMQEKRQHLFFLDEADLQRMETGLLNLLDQFNKGELRAFVASNTLEQMKQLRDRQERLAKMHFELYNEQERLINSGDQGDQQNLAADNLKKLTDELRDLNSSIQKLCSNEAK